MSKKKVSNIQKFRVLSPHSYHLHQLRWYYKKRGELKLEITYRPMTDAEEADMIADTRLKSKLPPVKEGVMVYMKLIKDWLNSKA